MASTAEPPSPPPSLPISSLDDAQELIACPVCIEIYDQDERAPMVLGCGHTTCNACCKKMDLAADGGIRCPVCRFSSTLISVNYQLRSIVESIDQLRVITEWARSSCPSAASAIAAVGKKYDSEINQMISRLSAFGFIESPENTHENADISRWRNGQGQVATCCPQFLFSSSNAYSRSLLSSGAYRPVSYRQTVHLLMSVDTEMSPFDVNGKFNVETTVRPKFYLGAVYVWTMTRRPCIMFGIDPEFSILTVRKMNPNHGQSSVFVTSNMPFSPETTGGSCDRPAAIAAFEPLARRTFLMYDCATMALGIWNGSSNSFQWVSSQLYPPRSGRQIFSQTIVDICRFTEGSNALMFHIVETKLDHSQRHLWIKLPQHLYDAWTGGYAVERWDVSQSIEDYYQSMNIYDEPEIGTRCTAVCVGPTRAMIQVSIVDNRACPGQCNLVVKSYLPAWMIRPQTSETSAPVPYSRHASVQIASIRKYGLVVVVCDVDAINEHLRVHVYKPVIGGPRSVCTLHLLEDRAFTDIGLRGTYSFVIDGRGTLWISHGDGSLLTSVHRAVADISGANDNPGSGYVFFEISQDYVDDGDSDNEGASGTNERLASANAPTGEPEPAPC